MNPKIVFFDMDHTLMDNDCDVSWKEFLIDMQLADPSEAEQKDFFAEQYKMGRLDDKAFLEFQLRQFRYKAPEEMAPLARRHIEERALPRVYPEARAAVEGFRNAGVPLVMLTATCDAISAPVAEHLGFDDMIATRLELRDGRYTGGIVGLYCVGVNKVSYIREYCEKKGAALEDAAYYGDSVADIPIMEAVGYPVAVNPSPNLAEAAERNGWKIERWKFNDHARSTEN